MYKTFKHVQSARSVQQCSIQSLGPSHNGPEYTYNNIILDLDFVSSLFPQMPCEFRES